ncbi:uncharacterized protein [Branchiostoma lanceolatum]|uniref:uncharacterized protein n=1 Tax=Branchiostoma lanceolatum TaxID=7740 RepID=UPI0034558027
MYADTMTGPCTSCYWKWAAMVLILATTSTVTAQVTPDIEVISAWPSANLYYQESLTLTCHGGGDPAPTYTWTHDPGSLPDRAVVDEDAGTLTVAEVTDSESGVYTCTADNGVGVATMNITVVGCPDVASCPDSNLFCPSWANSGQCQSNPSYMLTSCRLSCGVCFPNLGAHCTSKRRGRSWDTWQCADVTSVSEAVRTELNLHIFYQKYLHAYGIPILGSSIVSDDALRRACYIVLFMLADRKDIRDSYYNYNGRAAIMAETEVTLDIPEHSNLDPFFNTRARGLGGTPSKPVSTGAEENVLCYSNDRYIAEDIFLSEFAHGMDLVGARLVIGDFKIRLRAAYDDALASGLWANTYAAETLDEYFAEGVQSFFNVNHERDPPDGIHNHVNTRAELQAYDPALYALIDEIFPCGNVIVKRCERDYVNSTMKMDCFSEHYQRAIVLGDAVWEKTPTTTTSTQGTTPTVPQTPSVSIAAQSTAVSKPVAPTTDSVVIDVQCDQSNMTLSIPLSVLTAVDVFNMHLLDPNCVGTVDGDLGVVTFHTNLQECGTRQETSGDDKFIFYNEAIANQVTHANGAVRGQPINIPFHCQFLGQYDVSHDGVIMYNIPSPRVRIVDANNSFTVEMQMYSSTDFGEPYDSFDFPIQVTPSDRLNFGLSVTSPLNNLELFARDCVSTPTTDPNDSPQVNIIDDGCQIDETLRKESALSNDKALYYSVEAFTFPRALDPSMVYLHCTMVICFKDDPDSRCKQGCIPATRRRRAASDGAESRVRRGSSRDTDVRIAQGPFEMKSKDDEAGAVPAAVPLGVAVGASVGVAGVMILVNVAVVLVKKRAGLSSGSKKRDDDSVGLDNIAFQAEGKTDKTDTADNKA